MKDLRGEELSLSAPDERCRHPGPHSYFNRCEQCSFPSVNLLYHCYQRLTRPRQAFLLAAFFLSWCRPEPDRRAAATWTAEGRETFFAFFLAMIASLMSLLYHSLSYVTRVLDGFPHLQLAADDEECLAELVRAGLIDAQREAAAEANDSLTLVKLDFNLVSAAVVFKIKVHHNLLGR